MYICATILRIHALRLPPQLTSRDTKMIFPTIHKNKCIKIGLSNNDC